MLQALKLENAPTPAKVRSDTGSDPGDAVFAGLMAQASLARSPAAETPAAPREDRCAPSEAAARRPDAAPAAEPKEPRTIEPAEEPSTPENPAKAAVTSEPSGPVDPKAADPSKTAASPAEGQGPAAPPVPGAAEPTSPQAAVASLTPAPTKPEGQALKPDVQTGAQAPKTEAQAPGRASQAEALLQGIPQEVRSADEAAAAPATPTLTELAARDAQAPRPNAAIAKPLPEEASKPAIPNLAETTGEGKIGGEGANPPKAAMPPPIQEETRTANPEAAATQNSLKQPAPSLETAQVSLTEGAKAAQTTASHVEAAPRPSPVLAQVEGSIRWILQNKTQGAELQLHPESLGRMVIQLRVEGQEVHARLWASEPTSLAVLQDHKAFLESSLREQGLNLGSFDLHSGARGDGTQTAFQEKPMAAPTMKIALPEIKQEMPIDLDPDSAETHRIEVFA